MILWVVLCLIKSPVTDITRALDDLSQDNAEAKLDQCKVSLLRVMSIWNFGTAKNIHNQKVLITGGLQTCQTIR